MANEAGRERVPNVCSHLKIQHRALGMRARASICVVALLTCGLVLQYVLSRSRYADSCFNMRCRGAYMRRQEVIRGVTTSLCGVVQSKCGFMEQHAPSRICDVAAKKDSRPVSADFFATFEQNPCIRVA